MTVHKTRDIYIRHSRVPLPGIYSSLSEAFHKVHTDEIEVPGVEAVSTLDGGQACWIAVLPDPGNLGSWLGFKQNSRCTVWRQSYPWPDRTVGVLTIPLKRL